MMLRRRPPPRARYRRRSAAASASVAPTSRTRNPRLGSSIDCSCASIHALACLQFTSPPPAEAKSRSSTPTKSEPASPPDPPPSDPPPPPCARSTSRRVAWSTHGSGRSQSHTCRERATRTEERAAPSRSSAPQLARSSAACSPMAGAAVATREEKARPWAESGATSRRGGRPASARMPGV
eukprot:3692311-Prymnesium_polylepis.2